MMYGPALAGQVEKDLEAKKYMSLLLVEGAWSKMSGETCLRLANQATIDGRPEPGIKYFTKAIDSGQLNMKQLSNAYVNRAMARTSLSRDNEAMVDLSLALEANPQNSIAFYLRGNIQYKQSNFIDAIISYTNAIKMRPNYAKAYYKRGKIWQVKGDYSLAIKNLNKAIELDPTIADAFFLRCKCWAQTGETHKALADLRRYDLLCPFDPKVEHTRAQLECNAKKNAARTLPR